MKIRRLKKLVFVLILAVFICFICFEIVWRYAIRHEWVNSHLPEHISPTTTIAFVQSQILKFQSGINHFNQPEVWIVGASSIIDGVDVELLQAELPNFYFRKIAIFDSTVQDLPMVFSLRDDSKVAYVLFFYQLGTFKEKTLKTDWFHHWSITPYLNVFGAEALRPRNWPFTLKITTQSLSSIYRYANLLNIFWRRWKANQLQPTAYQTIFNYKDTKEIERRKKQKVYVPEILSRSYSDAYSQSLDVSSSGYTILSTVQEKLKSKNKKLVLIEAPQLNDKKSEKQTELQNKIISNWASQRGISNIALKELNGFKLNNDHFIDDKHMLPQGTLTYTKELARKLSQVLF